jgi:hypothetical protein
MQCGVGCRPYPPVVEVAMQPQYSTLHSEGEEAVRAAQRLLEEFAHIMQVNPSEKEHHDFLKKMEQNGWLEVCSACLIRLIGS